MADQIRVNKMATRIRHLVSEHIETKMRDQLGFITITEVRVTGDLHHATVFITVYGADDAGQNAVKILNDARGQFRKSLGVLRVRFIPTISFELDRLRENVELMDNLIRHARESDLRIAGDRLTGQY